MLDSTVAYVKASPDSIIQGLGTVTFWGAQTYMYVNILHFITCIVVVGIYCTLPMVDKNLYNRIVLRHNIALLILGGILTLLGFCQLTADCALHKAIIRLVWLNLLYFTNATAFWLNIVCLDMTLVITQFCWTPANNCSRYDDDRKLTVYSVLVWGGAFVPTFTAAVFEFVPQVPDNFPLKANFTEASNGPRPIVNVYFFFLPACTMLLNNFLFALTTNSIIKLYLLMGAPWFFGMVLACFNELVVLKICRTIQPLLWFIMLISRKKMRLRLTKAIRGKMNTENNEV